MNFNTFHWDIMNEIWAGHLKQRSGLSVCGHFYFMTSNPSRTEQTPVADSAVSTSLSLSKRELNTFQKFRNPLCSPELQESHWETSFAVAGEGLILSYPIFLLGHILFFSSPSPRPFFPFLSSLDLLFFQLTCESSLYLWVWREQWALLSSLQMSAIFFFFLPETESAQDEVDIESDRIDRGETWVHDVVTHKS